MQVAAAVCSGRGASCSKTAFSGATRAAPWRSDAILEAPRPCADGPASEEGADGAVATMPTIVATKPRRTKLAASAQVVGGTRLLL
jgi:hypothetical protein